MVHQDLPLDLNQIRRSCRSCGLVELCLPAGLDVGDLKQLDHAVRDRRLLEAGKVLFRQGDPFSALYVMRSGTLKTTVQDAEGSEQVLGFGLPGEIGALDAMAGNVHQSTATALERSSVCELPYDRLQQMMTDIPGLQRQLMRVVSREVVIEQGHLVMMGRQQAQEKLAIFLRSLSDRYARLGRDPNLLNLPMSRYDIANYLGLVVETVSRGLSRMEAAGVLKVGRKTVHILQPEQLQGLCGGHRPSSSSARAMN